MNKLPCRFGQLLLQRADDGAFELRHRGDAGQHDLQTHREPEAALEIARFDDVGAFRPLKTAPNLRRGWRLVLPDETEVRRALELFYPGRLAVLQAHENGALDTTPLRETLARQTGMYKVAAEISDAQTDEVVANVCRSDGGCLRTILWPRDANGAAASGLLPATKFDPSFDQTGRAEDTRPLLCQEACNLLVAAARKFVRP
ncbi:MAG: DR2241 family protein [Chthoniobacterales bacterium]